ncbi:hypothetical protein JHK87_049857 [Glycine soja]|nr:hypothetical protein JHK87_049857 [Glycine soja]
MDAFLVNSPKARQTQGPPLVSFIGSQNPRSILGKPRCSSTCLSKPKANITLVQSSLNERFTLDHQGHPSFLHHKGLTSYINKATSNCEMLFYNMSDRVKRLTLKYQHIQQDHEVVLECLGLGEKALSDGNRVDSLSYEASMTIFFGVDYADGTSEKVTAVYCVREEYSKMLNAEGEALKDSSGKSCDDDVKELCEKKARVAQNSTANICGKQLLKQKKDDSESEEGSKENLHSCESPKRSSYKQSQPCRKGEERKD